MDIKIVVVMMNNRNRSRDVSSEDQNRSSDNQMSSHNKGQQLSTLFNKTADVDDPPFSRLFLLIPKAMSEDELRNAFQIHGKIQTIHMVRDRRSQESKGLNLYFKCYVFKFLAFY